MGTEPRLVFIEWQDSYCATGWQHVSDLEGEPLICRSVGWLVKDNDNCKVLAPHLSTEHGEAPVQGNGVITIPARAILRTVDLQMPATATSSSAASESAPRPPRS